MLYFSIWNGKCDKKKKTVNFVPEKSIVVLPIPVAVLSKSIIDLKQNLSVLSKSIVVLLKLIVVALKSIVVPLILTVVLLPQHCKRARARSGRLIAEL